MIIFFRGFPDCAFIALQKKLHDSLVLHFLLRFYHPAYIHSLFFIRLHFSKKKFKNFLFRNFRLYIIVLSSACSAHFYLAYFTFRISHCLFIIVFVEILNNILPCHNSYKNIVIINNRHEILLDCKINQAFHVCLGIHRPVVHTPVNI